MFVMPLLMGGGASAVTYTYNGYDDEASPSTSDTFSAFDIGTASSDRVVLVIVAARSGAATEFTGGTIGGVTATVSSLNTGNGRWVTAMWAEVPTGTTADIVINFDIAPQYHVGVGVYSLYGASSTVSDEGTTSLDIPAGGIGVASYATSSVNHSDITGVDTEDQDETGGTLNVTIGSKETATELIGHSFSPCSFSISFGPA